MKCFPPVIDKNTEIIFLGSFPGPESLKQKQYYAHPQNQFWKLVGELINVDLHSMTYEDKLSVLKKHRVGLW
ncbi:DNA-deoxyinosine glycosylase, partial [Candidatus Woesearchaeota archaeon]|nr:DNA-deoxyinosine glycosylase [Candidatus Woesearchaeota archaeon]